MTPFLFVRKMLEARLEGRARTWLASASAEIADGVRDVRFGALISLASRYAPRAALAPTDAEREQAHAIVEGLDPERWSVLEALRVALVLSRSDLNEETFALALEEAFRYTDEGEACALYRSLALLPAPERFVWRAGEGCRTNMRTVFEAAALDTPYPVRYFDDVAWRQAVIKCVFIGAPLWRMWGLDTRRCEQLACMALDLADERRSAQRPVQPELWLCLGAFGGERARASLERELDASNPNQLGRTAAAQALALARADQGSLA